MERHDARLVPAALLVFALCGAITYGIALATVLAVLACVAVFTAIVWRLFHLPQGYAYACLITLTISVVAAVVSSGVVAHSGMYADLPDSGARVRVMAAVERDARDYQQAGFDGSQETRARVQVLVQSVSATDCAPYCEESVRLPFVLWGGEELLELAPGAVVELEATWGRAAQPDRAGALWDIQLLSVVEPRPLASWLNGLRAGFRDSTEHLPDHVRGLTRGMVIGDTREISDSLDLAMKRTGLAHLTAVSGAHFAIVALAGLFVLNRLRVWRVIRAIVLAGFMGLFALLVYPDPSVVRALWAALVVAAAVALGRRASALATLSSGVIGLLCIDPFLVWSVGFAMSVSAVAAIALWSPVLASMLSRWVVPSVARAIAVPLSAQLACAPLLTLIDAETSSTAVVANLLVIGCAAPSTIIGLLAVISPVGATVLASVASWAVWPVVWVAESIAALPSIPWPAGLPGVMAHYLGLILAIVARGARVRLWWLVAGLYLTVVLFQVVAQQDTKPPGPLANWGIAICDVGQGQMVVANNGDGRVVVIDTGEAASGAPECLRWLGVKEVSLLVLSHAHADHDGATEEIASAFPIGQVVVGDSHVGEGSSAIYDNLMARGTAVIHIERPRELRLDNVTLRLWPGGSAGANPSVNDQSVVAFVESNGVTAAVLGDLELPGQLSLAFDLGFEVPYVDVVTVPHHGSKVQSPLLAQALPSTVAVASVGQNRHGHPHAYAQEVWGTGRVWMTTLDCGSISFRRSNVLEIGASCPPDMAG